MSGYRKIYRQSIQDAETFWGKAARDLIWQKPWERVLDTQHAPFYKWFAGGKINACYNALDRHVEEGKGEQAALIYDSPVTQTKRTYSYKELQDETARLAGAMQNLGIGKGDRVIIYMPMIPQTVMAMLACARIGAIHSVVFGGFAAEQLAMRIDDAQAKLVLSASCGIEPQRVVEYKPLLDEALKNCSYPPSRCLIFQRPEVRASFVEGRDLDWQESVSAAQPAECAELQATDELFILYTSGTTGFPKGVVHDIGGYTVALKWTMEHIYGVQPREVFWAASDVGWIVGHSYIVYAPLFHGCTTVLYEGKPVGTPDAGAFWRVISEHRVSVMFTAPTAFRSVKKEDPQGLLLSNYDLSYFRTLFLAGERCDPDTMQWAAERLKVPVIDHWWQTETGWPITALPVGIETMKIKPGSAGIPMVGYEVHILDKEGKDMATGEFGTIALKLPLPPGTFPNLWRNQEKYLSALNVHPSYYVTGDAGYKDEEDYVFVMSRTDDVINVAGHRLSTGAIEEVLTSHSDIAEAAVFGIADELKGQLPLGLVIKNSGCSTDEEDLKKELVALVRERIGPIAAFKLVLPVARLPKTRSGKILRSTMRKIAAGEEWTVPATIEDPAVLDEIGEALTQLQKA